MSMEITYKTASDLKVVIDGKTRIFVCADAQMAFRLKQALEATDGSIKQVNEVIKEFKS